MRLTKHHGLGNDFIVALEEFNPGVVADQRLSQHLCDRRLGVGADGMLWGMAGADGGDLTMVLHNSDGSVAEISGNGIRCLGQAWLSARGLSAGSVVIDTPAGRRSLVADATEDDLVMQISVDMGAVTDGPELPPSLASDLADRFSRTGAMSIGNPHLILLVDDVATEDLSVLGPEVERQVPGGINVHVMAVLGPDHIELVHWERGAGMTRACGSGASVSAVVAHQWGLVGNHVRVTVPGGDAEVTVSETVTLRGPATLVALVETP